MALIDPLLEALTPSVRRAWNSFRSSMFIATGLSNELRQEFHVAAGSIVTFHP
jgi:hypothetical protein